MNSFLTKDDINSKVLSYISVMDTNPNDVYSEGDILYSKDLEFLGKVCKYEIILYNNNYIVAFTVDDVTSLEPLYIQIDSDKNILDDFFYDFMIQNPIGDSYFILEDDYKSLINMVSCERNFRVIENYF